MRIRKIRSLKSLMKLKEIRRLNYLIICDMYPRTNYTYVSRSIEGKKGNLLLKIFFNFFKLWGVDISLDFWRLVGLKEFIAKCTSADCGAITYFCC